MYKITFLGEGDPKAKRKRPKQIGSVIVSAADPKAALKEAHDYLGKQKPEHQKKVIGVEVRQESSGIKWD